jgi:hypothetical protein
MKIPRPRSSGEYFKTKEQRKCKHPWHKLKKHYLGRFPDGKGKMEKVWLVYCGLCGAGIRNKKRRAHG